MKAKAFLPVVTLSLVSLLFSFGLTAFAQNAASVQNNALSPTTVRQPVGFAISAPVSQLANLPQPLFTGVH